MHEWLVKMIYFLCRKYHTNIFAKPALGSFLMPRPGPLPKASNTVTNCPPKERCSRPRVKRYLQPFSEGCLIKPLEAFLKRVFRKAFGRFQSLSRCGQWIDPDSYQINKGESIARAGLDSSKMMVCICERGLVALTGRLRGGSDRATGDTLAMDKDLVFMVLG